MDIELRITQFEGETETHSFRLNFNSNQEEPAQWALLRWKLGSPKIPPVGQILTVDGWQGILNTKSAVKYVAVDDIEQFLKE